jgi:hypothetical protein
MHGPIWKETSQQERNEEEWKEGGMEKERKAEWKREGRHANNTAGKRNHKCVKS